jgi:hypothetical protein
MANFTRAKSPKVLTIDFDPSESIFSGGRALSKNTSHPQPIRAAQEKLAAAARL